MFGCDANRRRPEVCEPQRVDSDRQTFRRCVDAWKAIGIRRAVGEGHGAERVPVVRRRDGHSDRTDRKNGVLNACGCRAVIPALAEKLDGVIDLVFAHGEEIEPLQIRLE